MADKDWSILNNVLSTLGHSNVVKLARLGAPQGGEEIPAAQLPACFVEYLGTDEFPIAGDDEVFGVVRFRLALVVKGPDEPSRIESAMKLANDVKDLLMVDRFRGNQAAFGPAQKPTEFGAGNVNPRVTHPFAAVEVVGTCGFYTSEISR